MRGNCEKKASETRQTDRRTSLYQVKFKYCVFNIVYIFKYWPTELNWNLDWKRQEYCISEPYPSHLATFRTTNKKDAHKQQVDSRVKFSVESRLY